MPNPAIIKKITLATAVVAVFVVAYTQLGEYASLQYIKDKQAEFTDYYQANQFLVITLFFLGYVLVTSLSLPGAAIMTLLAGALFGAVVGTVLVSFASSIGATVAFLVARFLFGQSLREKYGDKEVLKKISEGVEKEGAFYLFAMRLVPAFPFFLINLLMSLTPIKVWTFYWVSQLGMLAGTIVYVYAGTELSQIEKLEDIASPPLLAAFVAMGILPFLAKKVVAWLRSKKAVKGA